MCFEGDVHAKKEGPSDSESLRIQGPLFENVSHESHEEVSTCILWIIHTPTALQDAKKQLEEAGAKAEIE